MNFTRLKEIAGATEKVTSLLHPLKMEQGIESKSTKAHHITLS